MILRVKTDKTEFEHKDGKSAYIATIFCDDLDDLSSFELDGANGVVKPSSIAIDTEFNVAMLNSSNQWVKDDGSIIEYTPETNDENGGE